MAEKKRPKDTNQLAKLIADIATGETEDKQESDKNPAAVAFVQFVIILGNFTFFCTNVL